ncbi:uncharacterized protein LOC123269836 [Cotesia glomerata]|uniref:uncharacterized protein LOC123269836 n=1 Tax=Cotesia glomerata TaxID=32391 RepID=UPI001D005AB4|nr:uncharacterized protein LOC123269836 [Cotesia glomerata]XP_044591637.1 uncharacterized protein LOC123269836 [Cotesia glomerata]
MDSELNRTTAGNSLMYQAIEDNKLEDIKLLLKNGMDVNEPIITTGEFAGFTALHVACMKEKDRLVELLVNDYKADVNVMAADGSRPIHLACFYQSMADFEFWLEYKGVGNKIGTLIEAKANVNAVFGQEIFSKHVKDEEWCPDFGDKMPLIAYTIIYNKLRIIEYLDNVNVDIISLTNKTLLMYAAENEDYQYIPVIMSNVKDPELMEKLINHRDNDDIPLSHYPLHPEKFGKFRYNAAIYNDFSCPSFISQIFRWGADMYALINNDPATFLPNLSAYRSCPSLLKNLLPYYTSMYLSRVLYYALLPIDETSEYLMQNGSEDMLNYYLERFRQCREQCIAVVLKDLVFRGVFRLPVPEEEIKLMDELIASDEKFRKIVDDYKRKFIEKELQDRFIKFGDNKMTMYNFFMEVYDNKKVKILAREENLLIDLFESFVAFDDYSFRQTYYGPIEIRIKHAKERLRLLENLKKISSLREAIPLPFEVVLDIVEYLNNKHLKVFIKAFYSS